MTYDDEDYLQEFIELTELGMSCREIVSRSKPSQAWFRRHIFPFAEKALCIMCRAYFQPRDTSRGTECSVICRNAYTGFGMPRKTR